jgi:hypothetical protein
MQQTLGIDPAQDVVAVVNKGAKALLLLCSALVAGALAR